MKAAAPPSVRDCIRTRIDAALEKVAARQMHVRAIYLTPADRDALDQLLSAEYGTKLHTFSYRDHDLRTGKRNAIYSTRGVDVSIPRRLSPRVAL